MGMADVATVLFRDVMTYDASWPQWPDRDRLILSAGHGSMLLYSALYLAGYEDVPIEEMRNFRQLGSKTPGHPEYGHTEGVETTTGPLGQGIANSVGFAMSEKWLAARCSDELVNHYTYVIAGDGCLMEGVSQEAISLAGHLELDKLIVLWDDNQITIDGKTELSTSDDQRQRFEAAGWHVQAVDGHDQAQEVCGGATRAGHSRNQRTLACPWSSLFAFFSFTGRSADPHRSVSAVVSVGRN